MSKEFINYPKILLEARSCLENNPIRKVFHSYLFYYPGVLAYLKDWIHKYTYIDVFRLFQEGGIFEGKIQCNKCLQDYDFEGDVKALLFMAHEVDSWVCDECKQQGESNE